MSADAAPRRCACLQPGWRGRALKGAVIGVLAWSALALIGLLRPSVFCEPLAWCLYGAVAMQLCRRWRRIAWGGAGLIAGLVLVTVLTPLPEKLLRRWVVDDGPAPSDLIVVLSGSTFRDHLRVSTQDRWVYGLRLLHQGVAPRILFTGSRAERANRFDKLGPELMADIGLDTTPVVPFSARRTRRMTTHLEAASLCDMAPPAGWGRVLVVTSPGHTRRARAAFRKAGIDARVTPCPSSFYDLGSHPASSERFHMVQELVYEAAACLSYRLHGWI
ncbi:MAG: YdcF family protein [Armatimonadetes bacterium]|nr:YdcF family protein [Armatimonadota bacterium]